MNFKKHNFLRIIILSCALITGGCAHFYYLPRNANVPLFKEKNDFNGSVSAGIGTKTSGLEVQAAYAVTDNLAVMANFMSSKYFAAGDPDDHNVSNGSYFDGAAGYFKPLNRFLVFEVFGGLGYCSQHHEYYAYTLSGYDYRGYADLAYIKPFLQPSIGASFDIIDIAFSSGITSLNFNKIKNNVDQNSLYYDELERIDMNRSFVLLEPAVTIRTGWKFIKLQAQYMFSFNLTHDFMYFEPVKGSLGIFISLSGKDLNYKSKNNSK